MPALRVGEPGAREHRLGIGVYAVGNGVGEGVMRMMDGAGVFGCELGAGRPRRGRLRDVDVVEKSV